MLSAFIHRPQGKMQMSLIDKVQQVPKMQQPSFPARSFLFALDDEYCIKYLDKAEYKTQLAVCQDGR